MLRIVGEQRLTERLKAVTFVWGVRFQNQGPTVKQLLTPGSAVYVGQAYFINRDRLSGMAERPCGLADRVIICGAKKGFPFGC